MLALTVARFSMAAGIPSITEFWASNGLSRGDFYLLEILFALSLLVLEVLTGRLADRFGIVQTLRLGFLAILLGTIGYVFAGSFRDFLIAEIFLALGLALTSGTDEACMYQSSKAINEADSHQSWWLANTCVGFVSMALLSIAGGFLAVQGSTAPFEFAAILVLLGLLLSLGLVEPPKDRTIVATERAQLLRAISAVLVDCPSVRWMCFAPALIMMLNQTFLWIYPEMLKGCGLSMDESGWAFALFNVVAGLSALHAWRSKRARASEEAVLFFLGIALACSIFGLLTFEGRLLWLFIVPQQVVRSIAGPLFSQRINDGIPDDVRATALSIRNAVRVAIYVSVMIPWWLWIDAFGLRGMFLVNLSILVLGLTVLWKTSPKGQSA